MAKKRKLTEANISHLLHLIQRLMQSDKVALETLMKMVKSMIISKISDYVASGDVILHTFSQTQERVQGASMAQSVEC